MKIRTDFVTNSSSSSEAEIVIENLVLLEILQKYKDMGLFGQNAPVFGIGKYEIYNDGAPWNPPPRKTRTPAFYLREEVGEASSTYTDLFDTCEWIGLCPKTLDQVLEKVISIMGSGEKYLDAQTLGQLKDELNQRKDEINHAYSSVLWEESGSFPDFDWYERFDFELKTGESFLSQDNRDDRDTTSEILIDNPVLLEILQKFKGMGLFVDGDPFFGIGEFVGFEVFSYDEYWEEYWEEYRNSHLRGTPAFSFMEFDFFHGNGGRWDPVVSPSCLDEVLGGIISFLDAEAEWHVGRYLNRSIVAQLKEELLQRADEIRQAYSRVYWSFEQKGTRRKNFSYDPIRGESFYEGDRHDEETGEEDLDGG